MCGAGRRSHRRNHRRCDLRRHAGFQGGAGLGGSTDQSSTLTVMGILMTLQFVGCNKPVLSAVEGRSALHRMVVNTFGGVNFSSSQELRELPAFGAMPVGYCALPA